MKIFLQSSLVALFIFSFSTLKSQQTYDFGFQYSDSLVVYDSLGNQMDFPWVGGFNSVHFQQIDLNFDSIMDLVVFEVHGSKLYTFVNKGVIGQAEYYYSPIYENFFPKMTSWVQLVDYNNDGKNDIFTYVSAGISVYKNISTPATGLKFELIHYMLYYHSTATQVSNIFVSEVDFPAITDVDDDGDIDIVQFYLLGSRLIYYENFSIQDYGDAEHFSFKATDKCWGKFAENDSTNVVYLNVFCSSKTMDDIGDTSKAPKHTGSTLLVHDFNADGKKDLLLGDVDYFNINCLTNGATNDSAVFISQNNYFPTSNPIDLISFPVVSYLDIDNDGAKELISAPFESTYYKQESIRNVWLYENSGQNNNPVLSLVKKNFFQDQMIDVSDNAMPELVDVDGDGLLDLLVSNYGLVDSTYIDPYYLILYSIKISRVTYYKNVGTINSPSYKFITSDWMGLSQLGQIALKLTFGDLDGDGDTDMLVGNSLGTLTYFQNTAGNGNPMAFASPVINYSSIDIGQYSAPELFDVDGDSLLDLTIGTQLGNLVFYKNVGTTSSPNFNLVTSNMGNAEMYSYWFPYEAYSQPEFWRDQNDSLRLFVGSFSGYVFYFKDIENNINSSFSLDSNLLYMDDYDTLYSVVHYMNSGNNMQFIHNGVRSAPLISDIDGDGYADAFIGTFGGGINFYKGIQPQVVGINQHKEAKSLVVEVYPNPTRDIFVVQLSGGLGTMSMGVKIYSTQGQLISLAKYNATNQIQIDASSLSPGTFIVEVEILARDGGVSRYTRKLVKL